MFGWRIRPYDKFNLNKNTNNYKNNLLVYLSIMLCYTLHMQTYVRILQSLLG